MMAEDQIRIVRNMPRPDKKELRRARTRALVLSLSVILSLSVLIYAFVQKEEAELIRKELLETQQALEQCKADH